MPVCCPKCGSRNLRFSRSRTTAERLRKWIGIRPLRCRDCRTRFADRVWRLSSFAYARCPKCWRMDLSRRDDGHMKALSGLAMLAVRAGAYAYRCEYCRYDFVSIRPRREKFSFHRSTKPGSGGDRSMPS